MIRQFKNNEIQSVPFSMHRSGPAPILWRERRKV